MTRWNVNEDKLQDVAYAVRQRAIFGGGLYEVYVKDTGAVTITMQKSARNQRHPIPAHCLVGTYDRLATTADIAADLAMRAKELQP